MSYSWVTQTRNYILATQREQGQELVLLVLIAEIFNKSYHVLGKIYLILQFIPKNKILRLANIILKNKNVGGLTQADFKTYFKGITIKRAWHRWKNRHKDQWNRVEGPEKHPQHPHKYIQLNFDKGDKVIQWRMCNLFNKWCCNNWKPTCKNK